PQASRLTTQPQVNPIWRRFSLSDADYERIRGGERKARVQVIGPDGAVAVDNGRLNFTASTVDPKTGAVQLRAEFPNPKQLGGPQLVGAMLMPRQFVKIRLLAGGQRAIVVPQ